MMPVGGAISNYKVTQEESARLVQENIQRGKEIEDNLQSKISEMPPEYTIIPFSTVEQVELTNGNALSVPHLLLHVNGKELKFHLVRCNFHGRGKLTDEVFSQYEEILTTAFGSILKVKK